MRGFRTETELWTSLVRTTPPFPLYPSENRSTAQHPLWTGPFRLLQLPEEIVGLILEMVPEIPPEFRSKYSLRLAILLHPGAVCSDLRRIWISTPRCWTMMFFCLTTELTASPGHLKLCNLFLARSGQCLIDLRLHLFPPYYYSPSPYSSGPAAQSLLLDSFTRCRSLSICDGRAASEISLITLDQSLGTLPHLAELELIVTLRLTPSQFYHPSSLLASCDPQVLRYLGVDYRNPQLCVAPDGANLWTALRDLRLRSNIETRSWLAFLRCCPNLEHLLWSGYSLRSKPEWDWDVSLPHLKTLKISGNTPNLDKFHAPELVQMHVCGVEDAFALLPSLWTLGRLPSLPRARFPSLRRLTIPGFEILERTLAR